MEENVSRRKNALKKDASLDKKETNYSVRSSGGSLRLYGILKFIFGVIFLPFVYSVSKSFINEFSLLKDYLQFSFFYGIVSFLILYLFIWEPQILYKKGQRFVEIIFRFFVPLVKIASYVVPIYTVLLFVIGYLTASIFTSKFFLAKFLFLIGFSIIFHLVFSAKSLKTKQADFLKANYIFGFSLVYIINIFLLSFGINLMFDKFSFVNFSNNSFFFAAEVFRATYSQLFL